MPVYPAPSAVAVVSQASKENTWNNLAGRLEAALRVGDRFEARSLLNTLEKLPRPAAAQRTRFEVLRKWVEELEKSSL